MNRAALLVLGGIVVLFSILIIYNAAQPKPFRWIETYKKADKQPYGSYVLDKQIQNFFPGNDVKMASSEIFDQYDMLFETFYDSLEYLYKIEDEPLDQFNLFGLDDSFHISELDTRGLLMHIYQGNDALIATNYINAFLTDELRFKLGHTYLSDSIHISNDLAVDENKFSVQFYDDPWVDLKPLNTLTYIDEYPEEAIIIGKNKEGDVIGIELEIGDGKLIFVTMPHVFSNYTILKTDASLSERLLTELPNRDTYWATDYWSSRVNYEDSPGLLSFIHSQESLKWAFYVLLVSVLIFFIFEIKRQQRAIRVIEPAQNITLKFSESISQLYLMRKDHREMVRKKMKFFLEKVRSDYQMSTSEINDHFYQRLSTKTEINERDIRHLFTLYFAYKDKSKVSEDEFLKFNRLVQLFKTKKK